MQTSIFTMAVFQVEQIAEGVKHFVLKPQDKIFNYLPGQFFTMQIAGKEKLYKRSYSIANYPDGKGTIEFAASYIANGIASEFLFALKKGDTINITGPFGRLVYKDTAKRIILVGTGTGVTPYRAMLPLLKSKLLEHDDLEVVILQGVREHKDILYAADFRSFVKEAPRASLRICLSRQTENLADDEYSGYVQNQFASLNLNVENTLVYLCGNPNMIDAAFTHLTTNGFTVSQIVREKYISSK
ncbi:MAG: hypothetical protein A3F18_06680 [Legionellales bacterium RIFCSPHIGHO2_12_FULL_37_14]|nr:MAG: hypothetical protein A3F18_06680 [Legionellales bacterium RIFCSPHIGHO2_12_FULL_37_14]